MASYTLTDQYAGKSLKEIQKASGLPFRSDILAGFMGVGEDQPLQAGQAYNVNLPSNYASSGEASAIQSIFTPGASAVQTAQGYQPQTMESTQQAIQTALGMTQQAAEPVISQLQSTKEPLKQQYEKLIASIKGQGEVAISKAETGAAQGYAARGLSVNSPAFQQYRQEKTLPVETQYGALQLQGEGELSDRMSAIDLAIANLQQGASQEAIDLALQVLQGARTDYQFASQQSLAQQELSQTGAYQQGQLNLQQQQLALSQQQANQPSTSIQTIGGRVVLVTVDSSGNVTNRVDLGSSSSPGSNDKINSAQKLSDALGKGITYADAHRQFDAALGVQTVNDMYNAESIYGPASETQTPDKTSASYNAYKSAGFTDAEIKDLVNKGILSL